MDKSGNLGGLSHKSHCLDVNTAGNTNDSHSSVSHIGVLGHLSTNSINQGKKYISSRNASEYKITTNNCGCRTSRAFGGGGGGVLAVRRKQTEAPLLRSGGQAAAALMDLCVQNTVEQTKQMHIKGSICKRDDPYSALGTDTFRKLLKSCGRWSIRGRRAKAKNSNKKKIKWCKPKVDECERIRLQLCPQLGKGHTHGKLIAEVSPVLLRAARNLDCQLHEICRRLFFMQHNVPQMTAPALVNFQAILAKITKMLIADFASFPEGLKLPDIGQNEAVQNSFGLGT